MIKSIATAILVSTLSLPALASGGNTVGFNSDPALNAPRLDDVALRMTDYDDPALNTFQDDDPVLFAPEDLPLNSPALIH